MKPLPVPISRGWLALVGLVPCAMAIAAHDARPAAAPGMASVAAGEGQAKGTGFAVSRHVVAGGGGTSTGGAFAVSGTLGQPDADPLQPSSGGVFAVAGGFWPGIAAAAPRGDPLFANGFED